MSNSLLSVLPMSWKGSRFSTFIYFGEILSQNAENLVEGKVNDHDESLICSDSPPTS